MKKLKLRNISQAGAALLALYALIGLSPKAEAVILNPSDTSNSGATGAFTGVVGAAGKYAELPSANFTAFGITGTFTQAVVRNTTTYGGVVPSLEFYYRFEITGGNVASNSAVNFTLGSTTYDTDVSFFNATQLGAADADSLGIYSVFDTATSLVAPASFARSVDGTQITFTFSPNNIQVGQTFVFAIKTDATDATPTGSLNFSGSGIATGVVYEPRGAPVPEPTTAIFGVALLGALTVSRKRFAVEVV